MTTKTFLFASFLALMLGNVVYGSSNIAIYWGQDQETTLAQTCATKLYSYVNIAFLNNNKGKSTRIPMLDITKHCNPSSTYGCKALSKDIKYCQSIGVKIFLSLANSNGGALMDSSYEARELANYLWNNFLGGFSKSKPFGDAVLDGIDFYIQSGSAKYYDLLARYLGAYTTKARKVYLSAAIGCPNLADKNMNVSLNTALFDYIWVRFYNNPSCEYNAKNALNFFKAWNYVSSNVKAKKVFLGLPASPKAVKSGFIPVDVLKSKVLPIIKKSPNYGGVMLWSRFWDQIEKYSPAIKNYA